MRRRLVAISALALAAAAPAAHAASPAWHAVAAPVADYPNAGVGVRFDPLGTAFGSWNGSPAQLVTRPSAGAFGTPVAFPTSANLPSPFGFAADGTGVFVGYDGAAVRAAQRSPGPGGSFGAVQTVVSGGGFPTVAVNAGGTALAAWGSGSFSAAPLAVAVRPPGGSFAGESLAGAGSPSVAGFGLAGAALDADGSGVVVYLDGTNVLRAVARSNAGAWSGPAQISGVAVTGVAALAANTAGDAVVVWNEGNATKAAVRPHDGAFGAAQTVASEGGSNTISATSVAIAADGTPFVALQRDTNARRICTDSTFQNYTAELWRRSGGTWSSVVRQEGQGGRVATSPTGDRVALAWEGFVDPCAILPTHAIHAQLGTVASLGADTLLPDQPPGGITDTTNTGQAIAIDGAGNALVTWSATRPETGGGTKLRVAAFDTGAAPPGSGSGGGRARGGDGGGDGGPDFADLLGIRAPVRKIPVDIGSGLSTDVFIDARCIERRAPRCEINANGVINGSYSPARASAARRRARAVTFSIKLPRVHKSVRRGASVRLKLTIKGRALAKVRTALKAHGRAKLTITLTVNGVRRPKPLAIPFAAARRRR